MNLTHVGLSRSHCVTEKTRPLGSLPPARPAPPPRDVCQPGGGWLVGHYECAMWCPSVLFCPRRWVVTPPWPAGCLLLRVMCVGVPGAPLPGRSPCVSCLLAAGWSVLWPQWRPHFPSVLHLETVLWPPCPPRAFRWTCLPSGHPPASSAFNPKPCVLTGITCGDGRWSGRVTLALRVCGQRALPPCPFPVSPHRTSWAPRTVGRWREGRPCPAAALVPSVPPSTAGLWACGCPAPR